MTDLHPDSHEAVHPVHEHGAHWLVCDACGAQWSVTPEPDKRPELVSGGDESCDDRAAGQAALEAP